MDRPNWLTVEEESQYEQSTGIWCPQAPVESLLVCDIARLDCGAIWGRATFMAGDSRQQGQSQYTSNHSTHMNDPAGPPDQSLFYLISTRCVENPQ